MGNSRGIRHFSHATIRLSQSLCQHYKLTNFCKHRVQIHTSLQLRQGNAPPRFSRHIHHGAVVAIATSRATADKLTMKPPWKGTIKVVAFPVCLAEEESKLNFVKAKAFDLWFKHTHWEVQKICSTKCWSGRWRKYKPGIARLQISIESSRAGQWKAQLRFRLHILRESSASSVFFSFSLSLKELWPYLNLALPWL